MSILPSTDIISEVAGAADPVKRHAAVARLANLSAPAAREVFSTTMAELRPAYGGFARKAAAVPAGAASASSDAPAKNARAVDAARKFEAYIIQSSLENILPKQDDGFFGKGTAGGVWRSMIAEHLSNQITKAGGVGLHKMLERHLARLAGDAEQPQAVAKTRA